MSATPHPDVGRLVLVSDLHCGSTVGLLAPGLELSEGRRPGLSGPQQWLWKAWTDFVNWVHANDEPYALVVNGDAIEGCHHRTTDIVSPVPSDHVDIAEACLAPLAEKAKVVYVVRGTEVHTGPTSEAGLAVRLGGERCPRTGMTAWDVLEMDVRGHRVRFVHHMPTTSRANLEASQLSIQLAEHQYQSVRFGGRMPDIVCAAHRHTFGVYSTGAAMFVAMPAWQFRTRFGMKSVPAAHVRVGGVELNWSRDGELPHAIPRLYVPEVTA